MAPKGQPIEVMASQNPGGVLRSHDPYWLGLCGPTEGMEGGNGKRGGEDGGVEEKRARTTKRGSAGRALTKNEPGSGQRLCFSFVCSLVFLGSLFGFFVGFEILAFLSPAPVHNPSLLTKFAFKTRCSEVYLRAFVCQCFFLKAG